jgi:hypothetical protein
MWREGSIDVILESVALVGGFLVTAIVGTPLAVLLARGRGWKEDRKSVV